MRKLLLLFALGLGCAAQPANVESGSDVFTDPRAYAGQTVRVEGVFQGYRAGECRFASSARSTALTRSDWLLGHDGNCLYVTGGRPAGLDPIDPRAAGRRLEVRAQVIDGGDKKFLLKLIEARILE